MAGDWIKMRLDLQTHPKIVRILSATKADKFRVIGGLHAVWSVFDTHSLDGRLEGYTPETLDHVIGWEGFSDAMIAAGWLAANDEFSLSLPEFDEHNGQGGKRRAEDQKRKRNDRRDPKPFRKLSAKDADEKQTREEKRREEKNLSTKDNDNVSPVAGMPMREVPPVSLDPAVVLSVALRRQGVVANSVHPAIQDWAAKGVTLDMLTEAVSIARATKGDASIPPNYLVPIVESLLNPPAARTPSQSRAAPVNEKFNFGHLDRSGDKLAMAESMKRHNITVPDDGEEIDI